MKSQVLQGYAMILLSAIGFGSYGVWSRIMGPAFGPFYQSWVKSFIILCILLPLALITKKFKRVQKADIKWLIIPVLFGSFPMAPIYYTFNHMDIGVATLIVYALFLITSYIIGAFFLRERMTSYKILSLCIALVGLFFIFGFSFAKFSALASIFAIIGGIGIGGEFVTTKKTSNKYSSLQLSIYIWIGTLLMNGFASLFIGEKQLVPVINSGWIAMVAYAFVGLMGSWLMVEGFKYVDASIGSLIGLSEIIASIFFGILLFKEHLTLSVVIGGGLIIFAAMLPDLATLFSKSRREEPAIAEAPMV